MQTLLPYSVLIGLSNHTKSIVFVNSFFPTILSGPFMDGVIVAFSISAAISFLAASASLFRGKRYIHEENFADKIE